jgi:hypothetical protein
MNMIQILQTHKKDILYKTEDGKIHVTTDKNNPQIKEALQQYKEETI